jgi:NADH:ubiquinone oxidoreductase subunit 3 (subunit A)
MGEFLGWVTAICFIAALCNYVLKRVNKRWIAGMPKESAFKKAYQTLMKFIVRYHRYIGIAAAVAVAVHLPVQVTAKFASVTGITAASLLVLTAVLGIAMYYGHKGKLVTVHRWAAACALAAFLVHVIAKI